MKEDLQSKEFGNVKWNVYICLQNASLFGNDNFLNKMNDTELYLLYIFYVT